MRIGLGANRTIRLIKSLLPFYIINHTGIYLTDHLGNRLIFKSKEY